ncbi:MAG: MMPL family transporter [Desulfobacterales bacterium]|nr:MMPL family transporter [Desulfobacterales bacterium]
MVKRVIQTLVTQHPHATLMVLLCLTLVAAVHLPRLGNDPSPELLAPDHPSRVASSRMRATYTGSNSGIMVMLSVDGTDHSTVFNTATLDRIQRLTRAFEAIHLITPAHRQHLIQAAGNAPEEVALAVAKLAHAPIGPESWMGVDEVREALEFADAPLPRLKAALAQWETDLNPVRKVSSLASTDNILARDQALDVGPIFKTPPRNQGELDRIRAEVMGNRLFTPVLVSNQGRNTGINIELNLDPDTVDPDKEYEIYTRVRRLVHDTHPGPEKVHIAGFPALTATLGQAMKTDSKIMFAAVTLIVTACLFITFRGAKGVTMPLTVVLLSLAATLGVMAFFKVPLHIITISLPVFVLSIGVADGIHMYSEYRDHILSGADRETAVALTVDHLTLPVIMTSLTTGAAFYAISITEIVQLHYCGLYVCLGALVAMVFSLLFIPALLMVLPEKNRPKEEKETKAQGATGAAPPSPYTRALQGLTRTAVVRPGITLALGTLLLLLFAYGATRVRVDNNFAAFFSPKSEIRRATQALNTEGAGSSRINFLLRAPGESPFKHPDLLAQVRRFMDHVSAQPEVGKIMGLPDLVQRIHFVLNDQEPSQDRLPVDPDRDPQNQNLISQLLLLYENSGGDSLTDLSNMDYTQLNLPAILTTNSSLETKLFTDRVQAWARQNLPGEIQLTITGTASVEAATTREIVTGQITGLSISILVVLVMLGITFRNLGYTLIAMAPLGFTITINFGVMGFLNIPLDIGSAIIASVVIGIGVDYSIHYLSRLKAGLEQGQPFDAALENTVRHSGKAIVSNAVTVGCGFLALWFASLGPLIVMGWLITLTMVVSALSALVFLPALARVTQGRVRKSNFIPSPEKG